MKNLKSSSIIIILSTLISRITGFIKEIFIASLFGVSIFSDIVMIAFRLPNLFRRIFGEGGMSQVFIPIYCKIQSKINLDKDQNSLEKDQDSLEKDQNFSKINDDHMQNSQIFFHKIFILLFFATFLISSLVYLFLPSIFFLIAPGIQDLKMQNLAILASRISIFYLVFICLASLFGASLNARQKFFAFSIMPVLPNIVIVLILYFSNLFINLSIEELVIITNIAFLIGGLLQLLFIVFYAKKEGIVIKITQIKNILIPNFLLFKGNEIKMFIKNFSIVSFSNLGLQLNVFASQSIASLVEGCVSIISYADRLYQFPLSIIGVTLSSILLPIFSKETINIKKNTNIIIGILIITLPAMFGIVSLADAIVIFVYERGAFTVLESIKTAETLRIFAFSLPGFILIRVISNMFFASLDTYFPSLMNILFIIINIGLNILLIYKLEHLASPLALLFATYIMLFGLLYNANNKFIKIDLTFIFSIIKALFASFIMFYSLNYLLILTSDILIKSNSLLLMFLILGLILIGVIIYCLVLLTIYPKVLSLFKQKNN